MIEGKIPKMVLAATKRSLRNKALMVSIEFWKPSVCLVCEFLICLLVGGGSSLVLAQGNAPDFRREVLPLLSTHCFACHGPDASTRQADMRLDDIPAVLKSNDVIVPGQPEESEFWRRLVTDDPDELMPPPAHKRPLKPEQIDTLRRWISAGAAAAPHWAFEPPVRPPIPRTKNSRWVLNPIDAFVLSRLEKEGLQPSPEANRTTLLRRMALDLTGLPPRPEEILAFVNDSSEDWYERAVDRLMASPHYGERMALPWLDAARYADSNGFQQDGDTYQYVWRDWVVSALNSNMPFDQFTIEQLAGDLLPQPTHEQQIATGFNRCHLLNGEGGAIAEEQRHVILFDRVDVTATNWLGLTLACAQCHEHKYDPVTQQDYYRFLAFFNKVPESGVPPGGGQYRIADPFVYSGSQEQRETLERLESSEKRMRAEYDQLGSSSEMKADFDEWQRRLSAGENVETEPPADLLEVACQPADERKPEDANRLRQFYLENASPEPLRQMHRDLHETVTQRDKLRNELPRVMIMSDTNSRQTFVLQRGNYEMPGEPVEANVPAALPPLPDDFPRNRLGLARWLVAPENPLVARVQVNRIWQHYWGQGLVKTPENFGLQSEPPVHPELLDWLAREFQESGWDMKHVHRLIVNSATYRQASRVSPELWQRDPENYLFARAARFRLPALILRDIALAASDSLDMRIGGRPVYPYQPADIWDSLAITKERDFAYPQSTGADLYRRSLYTFWRRTVAPGNMFDAGSRQACKVRTTVTNTPLHALTTLNDETWVEAARLLAARVLQDHAGDSERIDAAFFRVCGRNPGGEEHEILAKQLDGNRLVFRDRIDKAREFVEAGASSVDPQIDVVDLAALTNVCLTILNLDEALTRE